MGEYEKVNDELDEDEKVVELYMKLLGDQDNPFTDHFYRGIG